MVEVSLNSDEDFFLVISKQNVNFLEILLNCCLKYLSNDKKNNIRYEYLFISWIIFFDDLDKQKYNKEYLNKYKTLLYEEINQEYLNKNNKKIDLLKSEAKELENLIKNNPNVIIELLENL